MESRDTKEIVKRFTAAIRGASIGSPADVRAAAANIRSETWDYDVRAISRAFADMLDARAENQERILRESFGSITA